MTRLKPCPFCGGEVQMESNIVGIGDDFSPILESAVYCWKCDLRIGGFNFAMNKGEMENLWNRRASE